MSRNSSSADKSNITKLEYEEALKKSGYTTKLKYTPPSRERNNTRRKRSRKVFWFSPPLNLDVSANVAKIFLNLIEKHFPHWSKLYKIFNKNTFKVSYSFTQNMSQIIKGNNKKIVQKRHKRLLIVELRQIASSMVIAERKVSYINVQQQPVTRKKYILDLLRESLKSKSTMTISNLFKTNFMRTVLLFRVMYGNWKIEKI